MRVQFTDPFVANTKATGALSPSGAKAWSLHYTANDGRRARVRLGARPAMPLATARIGALDALGSLQSGTDPRTRHTSRMTVAELIEAYLAKHVRPNLRTADAIERRMRVNVIPLIGALPVAKLHRRDVNRVIDRLIARNAPAEANLTYADVCGCIRWADTRGDLDPHPRYETTDTAASARPGASLVSVAKRKIALRHGRFYGYRL
jgi:hypothetical protein